MIGGLIYINDNCNRCMECVEGCQSGVLKEDCINTILMLKRFNNHLRIHAWECTYCKSCEDICERGAITIQIFNEVEEI